MNDQKKIIKFSERVTRSIKFVIAALLAIVSVLDWVGVGPSVLSNIPPPYGALSFSFLFACASSCFVYFAVKHHYEAQFELEQLQIVQKVLQIKDLEQKHENAKQEIVQLRADVARWQRLPSVNPLILSDVMARKSIKYGHIKYPPLLEYDYQNTPRGIGLTILSEIFKKDKICKSDVRLGWDEIEKTLYDENVNLKVDIIATPLFETPERTDKIGFSSPLFYSEIGLYCSSDIGAYFPKAKASFDGLQSTTNLRAVVDILKFNANNLKFVVISGELSEKMAIEHFGLSVGSSNVTAYPSRKMEVPELVNTIAQGDSVAAFIETFQADQMEVVKQGKVRNVLKPKQLLYPVSYALRREDDLLRWYINLKLLELDMRSQYGVLDIIKSELERKNFFEVSMTEMDKINFVRRYFIREYEYEAK